MKPTWDTLRLHHVDLHYHAGTERPDGYSMYDYINYAHLSGRRILGVTDHFGRYLGGSRKPLLHYEGSPEGYQQFARDINDAREHFPDMTLLLAPEIGISALMSDRADVAFTAAHADMFLGEPGGAMGEWSVGETYIRALDAMARYRDRFGAPCVFVHPWRSHVNDLVGKGGIEPDVEPPDCLRLPKSEQLPPLSSYDDPVAHVEQLFDVDIAALAHAAVEHDIPFEINESTWGRMLAHNAEWFGERYLFIFRTLMDAGVEVVLGSDLHGVTSPAPTPFHVAQPLGLQPSDMRFLRHWLGPEER